MATLYSTERHWNEIEEPIHDTSMKNILVLTYWSYNDALIQTYTLPYLKLISKNIQPGGIVYLVTMEQETIQVSEKECININKELEEYNIVLIPFKYKRFGIGAIISWKLYILKLLLVIFKKKITHIHAWCTPAGAIGYLLSMLSGKPLIVDSYEPHAESMVENGTWKANGMAFRILFNLEKRQSKRASATIGLTAAMKDYAKEKYHIELRNYYVKPACVDFELFTNSGFSSNDNLLKAALGWIDKIVCIYAGKIGGIYLSQEIFDFFKVASDYWGDQFRILLLTNSSEETINNLIKKSHLSPEVILVKYVKHTEINRYMRIADFALNPVKPVPSKRYCTSIKDGEYWAMGLPIVIPPNISDDSEIIKENNIGSIIQSFDTAAYLKSVKEIDELLKRNTKKELYSKIRTIAQKHRNFDIAEKIYRKIYGKN